MKTDGIILVNDFTEMSSAFELPAKYAIQIFVFHEKCTFECNNHFSIAFTFCIHLLLGCRTID